MASARSSRKSSDDFSHLSATPDVIRTTILSLIPHVKLNEDKKRALILEVQKSDFNQASVIEYFIGIVGFKAYEAALRSTLGQSISQAQSSLPGAVSTLPAVKQVNGKAYCHGGDVAYFAGIDLEMERIINSALHAKRRRKRDDDHHSSYFKTIALTGLQKLVSKRTDLTFDEKYISALHEAVSRMAAIITSNSVRERKLSPSEPASDPEVTSLMSKGGTRIAPLHVLRVVRRMNESHDLPVQFTAEWENRIVESIVSDQESGSFSKRHR
jgi:hypothetical protein